VPYMVLEHLEGYTLRERMKQRDESGNAPALPAAEDTPVGLASPGLAVELMIPVVRALTCAHAQGLVHRGLKPSHLFLTNAGGIKVLDFGIAKRLEASEVTRGALDEPSAGSVELTVRGALVGTAPYMSPEQWRAEEIDARCDLWAVGIILYTLVTGTHPLPAQSPGEFSAQVSDLDRPMPSVGARCPEVGALGPIIDRCLKKRKAERLGSAEELLAALEQLRLGQRTLFAGDEESPFTGLSAFQEADAPRFYGRESEVQSVVSRLRHQPLVVVAGPSGA